MSIFFFSSDPVFPNLIDLPANFLKIKGPWPKKVGNPCYVSYSPEKISLVSESESELLLVTRSNDNHSPGPVMREVSP